jgi:hypothetical protein
LPGDVFYKNDVFGQRRGTGVVGNNSGQVIIRNFNDAVAIACRLFPVAACGKRERRHQNECRNHKSMKHEFTPFL